MNWKSTRFIEEEIKAIFDQPPMLEKNPGCPDGFIWRDKAYRILEVISEWHDYKRSGRTARNMKPEHATRAEKRGSWGVGLNYFRVLTETGQVFDLYYDRAPRDVDRRKGEWHIYRELVSVDETSQ